MSTDPNGNTNCSNLTDCYNCQNSSNCRPTRPLHPHSPKATLMKDLLTDSRSLPARQWMQPTEQLQQHE